MRTALVYDWLVQIGGGEKTLAAIAEIQPCPIYALLADRKQKFFSEWEMHTSFLQHFPFAKQCYRYYLPFFSQAIESLDVSAYDCVLSVSHAVAKGVRTHVDQLHLCYCFTPMRYAWDLSQCYMEGLHPLKRWMAQAVLAKLRRWDRNTSHVQHFAAISRYVAERIQRIYGREATVIYPPVDTDAFCLDENKEDYYLTVSRMVPYKKIDLIVEAFASCPDKKLIVIGDGPEMHSVQKKAGKNCEIIGFQSDVVVRQYMQKAKGFIFAAEEDFGIVPIEAQATGTPVIAFGRGGALETIISEETGIFFEKQTVSSMMQALNRFETIEWDPVKIRAQALRFSKARFQREFQMFVREKVEAFHESGHLSRR